MADLLDLAKPAKAKPLTSSDIRAGMLKRFGPPEWAIMWEVGEGTGAQGGRYADAVMMSLWPSRGLELHGVEIKVSRSDWKREAANPRKAEAIGKFCDRWWVHTSPGVVDDLSDVPPLWGLREFDGKKWSTLREAGLNREPQSCDRRFLAALLRRADEGARRDMNAMIRQSTEDARAAIDERVKREVDYEVKRRAERFEHLTKTVEAFEAASGITLTDPTRWGVDGRALGEAVVLVQKLGLVGTYSQLDSLRHGAEAIIRALDDVRPKPSATEAA